VLVRRGRRRRHQHLTVDDLLTAIQAFLEGERYYRRLQLDSAAAAFRKAIESDSTFAFAHLRLALSQEWSGFLTDHQDVADNFRTAARIRERLPRRERSLVEGVMLARDESPEAALEHLSDHVLRFPDHAEGWFRLADAQYHGPHALDLEQQQLLAPFDRAIELDPTFGPALPHALTLMVTQLDSASVTRYERELGDGGNPEWAERFRAAHALLWVSLDSLGPAVSGPLWGGGRLGEALHTAAFRSDRYAPDDVIEALRSVADTLPAGSPLRPPLAEMRARILLGTGRLRAAGPVLDSLLSSPVPWRTRQFSGGAAFAGFADADYVRPHPGPSGGLPRPSIVLDSMYSALMREDADAARMHAEEGLGLGVLESLFSGGLAWSQVMAGDTTAGRERLHSGMAGVAVLSPPVLESHALFRWLELLAADPDSRPQAIRYLGRVSWQNMPVYESLAHLVRARALEAEGDSTTAADAYDRFLELMQDADPDIGIRAEIEEAESARVRLGGG
jgi:tetratricopeptide (TPR) repeat protein